MKNLFISYELAVKLRKKEFSEPCFGYYNAEMRISSPGVLGLQSGLKNYNDTLFVRAWRNGPPEDIISAPLYQQVIDWFRETHDIDIWARGFPITKNRKRYEPIIYQRSTMTDDCDTFDTDYSSEDYYVALTGGLEEALKLI